MKHFSTGKEIYGATMATLTGLPGILACALVLAAPLGPELFPLAMQATVISAVGAA